ncbi:MAG: hypothetical protein HY553_03255 [Elusimicrobia bacterium]|nr:hypothetical protein [Elusimicrobiota bacterium]
MRLLLAAGLLVFLSASLVFFPDDPPPPDADLIVAPKALAEPDNAYHDFERIAATIQFDTGKLAWLAAQTDAASPAWGELEPLLARNEVALAHLSAFGRRASYLDPKFADRSSITMDAPIPKYWPLVTAARLETLRAARLAESGKDAEALERALSVVDAGQVLLRSESPLIATLLGMLTRDIGAKRARAVIERGRLDRATLAAAARRLAAVSSAAGGLANGLRFEYMSVENLLSRFGEYASRPPAGRWIYGLGARVRYLYLPNRTRGYFSDRFREIVKGASAPCSAGPAADPPAFPKHPGPNVVGRIFANVAMPDFRKLYPRRCESDYRVASAAASAAIAAYRLDRKAPPPGLDALVPGYLDAVLLDPFSGEALRFDPAAGTFLTPGKDSEGKPL